MDSPFKNIAPGTPLINIKHRCLDGGDATWLDAYENAPHDRIPHDDNSWRYHEPVAAARQP